MSKDKIKKAILKKALGYKVDEVVEEFSDSEGELRLIKRKVTTKHIPPDMTAAKTIMELASKDMGKDVAIMTEQELKEERDRLLKKLAEGNKNGIKTK